MKRIAVLGSTGTIGMNTLDIARRFPENFEIFSLAAGRNLSRLREQIREFKPRLVSVQEEAGVGALREEFPETAFVWGERGLEECVRAAEVEIVVVGIVGFAAMAPTLAAVRAGKQLALANKEVLVVGGPLFRREVEAHRCRCIPVDSEHNALFQLLEGNSRQVQSLVLTASGGPLLRRTDLPLEQVTPEIAVKHPNWKMGPKISVDSATLMNKGLELIEAHFLFEVPEDRIEVWVHPQSILHGAIWFEDNSCLAQLSKPDMRSSIAYALAYPERLKAPIEKLSMAEMAALEFLPPDERRFPALGLARRALRSGPSYLVALNAANEVAVESFLQRRILFPHIARVVEEALERHQAAPVDSIDDIFGLDDEARRLTGEIVSRLEAR